MDFPTFLIMAVFKLGVLSGCMGQQFSFDSGLQYTASCGLNPKANWSAEGSVTLTSADFIGFQHVVVVHAVQELCTVDLTSCPPDHLPTSAQSCFCKSKIDDKYNIHVGAHATLAHSGMTLQAVVPGRGALDNIYGAVTLGTIPNMKESKLHLNVSYTLNDGQPRDLLSTQTVTICPNKRFIIAICVDNGKPNADLAINVEKVTLRVLDGRCVTILHKFSAGEDRTMTFEYKEPEGCLQRNFVYFQDDVTACTAPTVSTTLEFAKTTDSATPTTTENTTTPAETTSTSTRSTTTTTTESTTTTTPTESAFTSTESTSVPTSVQDQISPLAQWPRDAVTFDNLPLPYTKEMDVFPGKTISIIGKTFHNTSRITVNFVAGSNPDPYANDVALHFDARFSYKNYAPYVVLNSIENHAWGQEIPINDFPFTLDAPFEITILADINCFKIDVNLAHVYNFSHRILPMNRTDHLNVQGDFHLTQIRF